MQLHSCATAKKVARLAKFVDFIGIDYSGAETADSSLKGLRVYRASLDAEAQEIPPPPSPKRYWTRRGLADWLVSTLENAPRTLVGIDHGFSFPKAYFDRHGLEADWETFLIDFKQFWPTDERYTYVDFARYGRNPTGMMRQGERKWRRRTEVAAGSAKSVFHFDVQGSVAKSTHAGLPWLLFVRRALRERVHFWPFDGWTPDPTKHVIAEVYPRLWNAQFPAHDRMPDQHDAYSVATWLRDADAKGELANLFEPTLPAPARVLAAYEGWILGVTSDVVEVGKRRKSTKPKVHRTEGGSAPTDLQTYRNSTTPGFINQNNQVVIRSTGFAGNDHHQKVFVLHCAVCDAVYGASGSDIHLRKCPACQGGAPGLRFRPA